VPVQVADLVHRCLQKQRKHRFASALDLRASCVEVLAQIDGAGSLPRPTRFLAVGSSSFAADPDAPTYEPRGRDAGQARVASQPADPDAPTEASPDRSDD
jgi:hypothetical protein